MKHGHALLLAALLSFGVFMVTKLAHGLATATVETVDRPLPAIRMFPVPTPDAKNACRLSPEVNPMATPERANIWEGTPLGTLQSRRVPGCDSRSWLLGRHLI